MEVPSAPLRAGAGAPRLVAGSGVAADAEWPRALDGALLDALAPLGGEAPDLLLLFCHAAFGGHYDEILHAAAERTCSGLIAGCSGSGVIGRGRELEGVPAIAALALRFPAGGYATVHRLAPDDLETPGWERQLVPDARAGTGLIVLADPFSTDVDTLVTGLATAYPDLPIVGGLASGEPIHRHTHVFAGERAWGRGAVVVALGGTVRLQPIVSQGCEPIGQTWTITEVDEHVVRTIGNRPAYEVLVETLGGLDETERRRAARNLVVGLAMDEYRDAYGRGDFLIRTLAGIDPKSGAIAVGARPRVGQTLQFQVRDARAADEELRALLPAGDAEPAPAALLFACNGRGAGLFGSPDHDARAAAEILGDPPLAGFFCNGEIGPVGRGTFVHGFTASLGIIR
jgi:small ligand-binding sensory domain FIST